MSAQALDLATSVPASPRGGPWKFWGTTLWGIAILTASFVVGSLGMFAALIWLQPDSNLTQPELMQLLYTHVELLVAAVAAALLAGFAVIALAVRLSRLGTKNYLDLVLPRGGDTKVGLAALVFLYTCYALVSYLIGDHQSSTYVSGLYQSARSSGRLVALAFGLIVVAPVSEELLIRGFLLRGWAESRLGPVGAVLLTTAIWTAMHTQYNVFVLAYIFGLGLLLGWLRLRSGSTVLTILLHALQNSAAFLGAALVYMTR
jgi:uncharacterized protein